MKTMKTSELTGAALDWAVAKCEGWVAGTNDDDLVSFVLESSSDEMHFWPSTDWTQGGPIIEREKIETRKGNDLYFPNGNEKGDYYEPLWVAGKQHGQTPLIAAMRCYVASKLGEKITVPLPLIG